MITPEAAVLALHQHEHTEDIPASDTKISVKHQHCYVDDLFNSDFTVPEFFFILTQLSAESCYIQPYNFAWKFTFPNNILLRGPPTA